MTSADDIAALRREMADLERQFTDRLNDITDVTGCTNPVNVKLDAAARQFIAWWLSDDGRACRARWEAAAEWHQHQEMAKDEARQRLSDLAVKLGIGGTVSTLIAGVVGAGSSSKRLAH